MSATFARVTPRPGRLKQCCRCRAWQPLRRFGVERRLPDGHRNECLACRNDRRRALKQGAPRVHPWAFAKNKENDMIKTTAIALLLLGCSSTNTNVDLGTSTDAEVDTSSGGQAGSNNPPDGAADADTSPCGPLMLLSGSICVDKQPALRADGSQGASVSWADAAAICASRGARLCTTNEREAACPGGQGTFGGGNGTFCNGPANTWEWSVSTACVPTGSCKSPCCNTAAYPCQCNVPATDLLGYRCCK